MPRIELPRLAAGKPARVVEIRGGSALVGRLDSMGIFAGATIARTGSFFGRGPVVVTVGQARLALGRGMAAKIIVEPVE